MKKKLFFIFIFIFIFCSCSNNSNVESTTKIEELHDETIKFKMDIDIPDGYDKKKADYKYGEMKEYTYNSTIYNETKHFSIILPYNYDSNKTYPLVITIPSLGESNNNYNKIVRVDAIAGNLMYENKIKEAIILIPNHFMGPNEEFSINNMFFSDKSPLDINKNVLPIVKENYKISDIYLYGFSMGGREAANYILQFGDIKAAALVEPFFYDKYAAINNTKIDNLYLIYGTKDGLVLTAPSLLNNVLNSFGMKHEYIGVDFDHDFECGRQMLFRFLNTVLEVE